MKKLLSLSLAVLMLCSLFTVNAFATATTIIGGNRDNLATGEDGVTDFTPTSSSGDVSVKVDTITHKYSVDITYSNMEYTPTLIWDPGELEYVAATGDFTGKVTITLQNYSDLPVYASAKFDYDANNKIAEGAFGFAFDETYTNVVLPAAKIGAKGAAVEFKGGLTGADTPEKIANAITYYKGLGTNTITIGTCTVTISKTST